jgi:hypothetical protein
MQDVEDAIGEDDGPSCRAQRRGVAGRFLAAQQPFA